MTTNIAMKPFAVFLIICGTIGLLMAETEIPEKSTPSEWDMLPERESVVVRMENCKIEGHLASRDQKAIAHLIGRSGTDPRIWIGGVCKDYFGLNWTKTVWTYFKERASTIISIGAIVSLISFCWLNTMISDELAGGRRGYQHVMPFAIGLMIAIPLLSWCRRFSAGWKRAGAG